MERIETMNVNKIWYLCGRDINVFQKGPLFYTDSLEFTQGDLDAVDENAAETARVIYDRTQWVEESYRSNPDDHRLNDRVDDGIVLESSLTTPEYERRVLRNTWKEEIRQAEQALVGGIDSSDSDNITGEQTTFWSMLKGWFT